MKTQILRDGFLIQVLADLAAADEATQLASLQAAIRRLNIHNLNTGYMKCREVFNTANGVANRQGSWIKWPLGPLFASS